MIKINQGQRLSTSLAPPGDVGHTALNNCVLPVAHFVRRRDWLMQAGAAAVGAVAVTGTGVLAGAALAQSSTVATSTPVASPSVAFPALASTLKLEKKSITIAAANKTALAYLPLTVAEQLGYFALEGLTVEVTEPPSPVRAQQLASSGAADMVCGWIENTLALQAKGQPFSAFVLMGRAPQIAVGVSVKAMPEFKTLADLAGKRVGIVAPGTPSHTVVHAVLARAGLRLGDMNFVSVGTASGALAALRAGQIDAISYFDPLITQLEQRGELRMVADTRTVRGTTLACGGDMPASCLFATPEFIQKNPATVQAATHAIVHALKWLQTAGVSDLMKTVPESYFAGDRALYFAAFARMREAIALDGLIPAGGVRNTLDAMRNAEPLLRAEVIDPDKCFTNAFAQKSKLRFKV
jgi:NitT/TauT family transport system substrate-binding protein